MSPELPKVVLHGLVGGALSELSGGDFTSGAIATATSHIVAEHVKDHYYKQAIRGEISVEELKGKVLAISGMVGGAAAIAMNPDITPEELNTARTMSESVAEHNSLKLVISAVKVVKKLAQVKGKLSKEKVFKAFKDEGLDIIDDLHTLADDEVGMDDVLALADLAVGTNLSNKQMRAARNAVDEKNVARMEQKVDASGGAVVAKGIPSKATDTLAHIKKTGNAPPGYKGGRTFKNDGRGGGQQLSQKDASGNPISYKEYDVNPYQKGVNRGAERLVHGSDGKSYYTNDHYKTFTPIE